MIDLFLALFGGTYYATKTRSDKSNHKRAAILRETDIEQMKSDYYCWRNLVVDEGLERKLIQEMSTEPGKTFETIKAELNNLKIFKPLNGYQGFIRLRKGTG